MSEAGSTRRISAAAYLRWEREQTSKHEYHRGEVFLMEGGSPRHNFLASAIGAELRAALRERGCHVLSSDQRLATDSGQRYVYADAVVVCGELQMQPDASDVLLNPTVVVEVLSRSTEAYDRGDKWEAYQRLASLTDYVLISQGAVRVENYQRQSDGAWRYRRLGPDDESLVLANGGTVAVGSVYAGAFELPSD